MRSRLLLMSLLAAACSKVSPPEPRTPAPAAPSPAPAPSAGPQLIDEGVLHFTTRGKPSGEESFKLFADGERRELATHTRVRRGEVEATVDGTLVTDASFRPESGHFVQRARDYKGERTLARQAGGDGGPAALALTTENGATMVEEQPSDLYVDNLVASHLTPLCSLAGDDERSLRLFPGMRLTVSGSSKVEFATSAGPRVLNVMLFKLPGSQPVDVLCDGSKLVMVRQEAVQVVSTREGYEEIAAIIAEAEDRKPKIPEGLVELERKVTGADGVALACSLLAPAARPSPLPSVVLVGPAGGQDRDGDTPGHGGFKTALLRQLAIALAQSGVASLRCDDRGVGDSAGSQAKVVLQLLAADAAAQVAALRTEPGIDPDRVGLVGHAEGATVAQLVAADDPKVKALALLAGMGRTLDAVSLDVRAAEMRRMGIKDEVVRAEHKRFAAIYAAIRAGTRVPEDTPDVTRAALAPMVPYLQSQFRHDPGFTARKIKVPVLLAHGGKDAEVPPGEAKILQRLLAGGGNRKVKVKIYPQLNHVFTPVKKGTAEDFSDPELAVDLAFVGDVVTFLKSTL